MRKTTYIQAINEAMRDEMRRDERVFLIGEDIGHYGGLFRVTRNMMEEFGERRVIDTPIISATSAECAMRRGDGTGVALTRE